MKRLGMKIWLWLALAPLLALGGAGCVSVVRPPPLAVSESDGETRVVEYPPYVLVHDSNSFWDAHQLKDNFIGLADGEIVHWLDSCIDGVTPGPKKLPVENGVEWIKNSFAQLPDSVATRIAGGLFSALGIEKTTVVSGVIIAIFPTDPISYFGFTRAVYLTDWVQETLGEANAGAGHLAPWEGPFVPLSATTPVNKAADWAQSGSIALYIYVFHKISTGLDSGIDGCEYAWGWMAWKFESDEPQGPLLAEGKPPDASQDRK